MPVELKNDFTIVAITLLVIGLVSMFARQSKFERTLGIICLIMALGFGGLAFSAKTQAKNPPAKDLSPVVKH